MGQNIRKGKKVKYRLRRTVRRSTIQQKYVDGEKRKSVKTNTDAKKEQQETKRKCR